MAEAAGGAGGTPGAFTRERCSTGIEALDNILEGGIPRGNTVLVAGSVGTGKTTLSLEFLLHGAERGERSLFLSVTEPTNKLVENMRSFEFFRPELLSSGALTLVDIPLVYEKLGLDHEEMRPDEVRIFLATLDAFLTESKAQRVVLDSLTSLAYRIQREERIRDFMLRLSEILAAHGCTSLLVSEIGPQPGRYSLRGVEEAIVDGVMLLGTARRHGDMLRVLQVVKMRGTSHSRAEYVVEMTPIGLLLAPHFQSDLAEEG
ncbi:MAG: RAD55 family ATPase [Thermoplasmata archaeon]